MPWDLHCSTQRRQIISVRVVWRGPEIAAAEYYKRLLNPWVWRFMEGKGASLVHDAKG
jgi:hypothetical protein